MYDLNAILISNGFGIILTVIILLNSEKNARAGLPDEKIFNAITWTLLTLCSVELLSFISDSLRYPGDVIISRILNAVLFMLNLVVPYLWLSYVSYKVFGDRQILRKFLLYGSFPVIAMMILGFLNIFVDIFFTVSPDNIYSRLPLTYIPFIIAFLYPAVATLIVFIKRKKMRRYFFFPMFTFLVFPICGAIIQIVFYGFSLMWSMTSISVIIVYLNVQKETASIDTLTGLYTRMRLDVYLRGECPKRRFDDVPLVGIMLDVDKFKSINDTYGHAIGDDAIESVGRILRTSVKYEDFVARYAGDEFMIITKASDTGEIENIFDNIRKNTEHFNNTQNKQYSLSFSIGYTVFGVAKDDTIDKFLKRMDIAMYKDKNKKAAALNK